MSVDWAAIGSTGTAVAVFIAAWQVRRNTKQARTSFEDTLAREYRELARGIPVDAHLAGELAPEAFEAAFPRLFQYIDLSNEQVFLRMTGRITAATWFSWSDGIRSNLRRPAFRLAWERIKEKGAPSFQELRRLEATGFSADPRNWVPSLQRLRGWLWH